MILFMVKLSYVTRTPKLPRSSSDNLVLEKYTYLLGIIKLRKLTAAEILLTYLPTAVKTQLHTIQGSQWLERSS